VTRTREGRGARWNGRFGGPATLILLTLLASVIGDGVPASARGVVRTVAGSGGPAPPSRAPGAADTIAAADTTAMLPSSTTEASGAPLSSAAMDTIGVRFELGASADLTNEQFYEDRYDSLLTARSTGRRLVSTPEARAAVVGAMALAGTRADGGTRYGLRGEWSEGDVLRRGTLDGEWRQQIGADWRLSMAPRGEYRHDRAFDRDLEEWRAGVRARARRDLGGDGRTLELGTAGEVLRTAGPDAGLLPDRNSGTASVALDHDGLAGQSWRLGYLLTARTYPDSMTRDHLEHGWEAGWRRDFPTGALEFEADGERRSTLHLVTTSRDNFWEEHGTLEGHWTSPRAGSWRSRLEWEALQYDLQDTTLYFDYQIVRVSLGPRLQPSPSWTLFAGPRYEMFFSANDPGEQYREVAGELDWEWIGSGAWWNVTPVAGWRTYDETASGAPGFDAPALHSSYSFVEMQLLGDQSLGRGWRVRALGMARAEFHTDGAQDARSLYFSLDVRKLF
jgi:hypothetical protein